jgi:hypothetical protein
VIKAGFRYIAVQLLRSLPGAARDISNQDNLNYFREIIHYNQAKLIDYNFLGSQKHKLLKENYYSLLEAQSGELDFSTSKLKELQDQHRDLSVYLHSEFRRVCNKNFEYLKKFYSRKLLQSEAPRICIKVVREGRIITFHREKSNSILEEPEFPVRSNTAFKEIDDNGKHFLCNNIPLRVKNGTYINPRIYHSEVLSDYKLPSFFRNLKFRFLNQNDYNWRDRWQRILVSESERELPNPKICYKSTLVIPITLENQDGILSDELNTHLRIPEENSTLIFGFLCLDHKNINFFNHTEDVDIGYIFAEMISLYIVQLQNFTDYSSVFKDSLELLRNNNLGYTPSLPNILNL